MAVFNIAYKERRRMVEEEDLPPPPLPVSVSPSPSSQTNRLSHHQQPYTGSIHLPNQELPTTEIQAAPTKTAPNVLRMSDHAKLQRKSKRRSGKAPCIRQRKSTESHRPTSPRTNSLSTAAVKLMETFPLPLQPAPVPTPTMLLRKSTGKTPSSPEGTSHPSSHLTSINVNQEYGRSRKQQEQVIQAHSQVHAQLGQQHTKQAPKPSYEQLEEEVEKLRYFVKELQQVIITQQAQIEYYHQQYGTRGHTEYTQQQSVHSKGIQSYIYNSSLNPFFQEMEVQAATAAAKLVEEEEEMKEQQHVSPFAFPTPVLLPSSPTLSTVPSLASVSSSSSASSASPPSSSSSTPSPSSISSQSNSSNAFPQAHYRHL